MLPARMRLGFIGPCRGDPAVLRPLAELLLFELDVARAVYLGADDALDRAAKGWPERLGAPPDEATFLREAAVLALEAPPEALEALLERDHKLARLADLAVLPPPPARAVELLDDRIVLMVFDKSVLDEDDVANATVIVWGNAQEPMLKVIGPRVFLTPGWVTAKSDPCVAMLDCTDEAIQCAVLDKNGKIRFEHKIPLIRGAKMGVR